MIIALLFNWRAYPENDNYWEKIREVVFKTGIIQKSGRHMKLAVGDILVGLTRGQDPEVIYRNAFAKSDFSLVDDYRLCDGFPTVFGMVFENMPRMLAVELDAALLPHDCYLGALSVHLEFPPHRVLYRSRLSPQYRIHGTRLRRFFSMGNEECYDPEEISEMQLLGFSDVALEDTGMARTVLDDFDTLRHFERIAAFRELLSSAVDLNEDEIYQLTMLLEDLSPKLFNALGAAAERLKVAENEEDLAQVALSGRRYMEQLADALFPAVECKRRGRALTAAAYKNRLWAFVEDHDTNGPARLQEIGAEIDRVVGELNGGLHSNRSKKRVAAAICDAAILTARLFSLAPEMVRNGYLAYMEGWRGFVEELAVQNDRVGH
ncbi:hypothetical protein EOK75_05280 [Pseudorhodobacter turbinis]|uniref:Uncharacterized protein n=1 Tax=Pseudorhodobacter turbinis TaxID=2500533 RepID=A0A4P8EEH9_9RHOB|nr:hypothetical protein [Pseudorhodobacter turbinis]QCO55236.1 hypothetical protein EOK75_05280 [Pseudorhodobacter turbinis]